MILVIFAHPDMEKIRMVMDFVKTEFPETHSLQYIINSKKNDTLLDQEVHPYSGAEFILEKMGDLKFRISAKSFYQTNSLQAEKLYALAREMARFEGNELVFDLYTGTGTIANFIASSVKKVIGLEYVEVAIQDAQKNAELNGIQNAEFYCGDIRDLLRPSFTDIHGLPDIIITDPPRAGMHPEVVESLINIQAKKIIYISCNPSTQARDLIRLQEFYDIQEIQPVDMFPQTQHVENIVLLTLKNSQV
jgi:23S rRNA (uracil1939-C5)-methyltransferase